MNVTVFESNAPVEVGDVIGFRDKNGGYIDHYLVCNIEEEEKFFLINLSGKKRKLNTYDTIEDLMKNKKNYSIFKGKNVHIVLGLTPKVTI